MTLQDLIARWGGLSPAQVAARASDHLPFWISLLAVVLIAYYLARMIWLLVPAGTDAPWQPPAPARASGPVAQTADNYAGISAAHLFGEPSTEAPALTGDAALNAPDTNLSLQLRGAIAAEDPKFAHAIIADAGGVEHVYFANATLPGGAVLQQVKADLVILSRGGQLEVLRLPRESGGASGSAGGGPIAAVPEDQQQQTVQDLVSQNAATFLQVVRPQPFMPNGQLKGYRIYPGPNRQQFSALGLRAGDLVTELNGIALNNPSQGMEVFRNLGDAAQVTVTVERDGQPQVLSLNMAQMNSIGASQ